MVRIRLQRHGRKRRPYYFIVAVDQRSKRDGRFLEKLGTYDPMTQPQNISINVDRALDWILKGASPSDTAKALLSSSGVYLKKHLLEGVKKESFDQAEAQKRFDAWLADKQAALDSKLSRIKSGREKAVKEALLAERKVKEAKFAERKKKEQEKLAEITETEKKE